MKPLLTVAALCATTLLSACTTSQMYNSLQDNAQDSCNKLQDPDRSVCLKRNQTDYDTYKKQREAIIKNGKG